MRRRSSSSVRIFYPEFDRGKLAHILAGRLKLLEARLPLVRVVLFGSYARGSYTIGSDIDLLVVYRGRARRDAYAVARKVLAIPRLEPHLYSEAQYKRMKGVIGRIAEGGIFLLARDANG